MTDIQYVCNELIKRIDELAIDDLLRLKIMLYLNKSLESEEVLNENCKVLERSRRKYAKNQRYE